jgi:AcrR family transcriptional regulator
LSARSKYRFNKEKVMSQDRQLFLKRWYKHAEKLIPSSAKDGDLIELKHQQIVEGACRVFFKKGFHPTTIREIAQACDMSMGQLYHYISSKDDVLFLVHKHMQKSWYEHLSKSRFEEIDDPLKRFVKALQYTLEFLSENKKLFQFVYTESKYLEKKHLRAILEIDDENVVGFWRQCLEEVNKKRPVKVDINFGANLIAYLMVFLPLRGWNLRDRPNKEYLDFLVDFVLRGSGITR